MGIVYICIYITIYNDEINQLMNGLFFTNESYFFLEYNPNITELYVYNKMDFNYELFIDYHIVNYKESINNTYIIIFITFNIMSIFIYEVYLYMKPMLYSHEILYTYLITIIFILITAIDIFVIEMLYNLLYISETTDIYYNIEWASIDLYNNNYINILLFVYASNILAILYYNTNKDNYLIIIIFLSLIMSNYLNIEFIDCILLLIIKIFILIEVTILTKNYMYYLLLLLQKKSIGNCTGIYKIK
jgi:hypothetical protein